MNKKIRKLLMCILVLFLVISTAVLPNNKTYAANSTDLGIGNTVQSTIADTETSVPTFEEANSGAGAFQKAEGNGRIWVDKSVIDNKDGTFNVDLSALTQEYVSTVSGTTLSSTAADVVFILDGSGSMFGSGSNDIKDENNNALVRLEAMVKATNEAIKIIMDANPDNRVAVYVYTGKRNVEFMKMDSYFLTDNSTQYIKWGKELASHMTGFLFLNDNLVNGEHQKVTYVPKGDLSGDAELGGRWLLSCGDSTPTQLGVVDSIEAAITNINNSIDTKSREPYVFLLSDGGATFGSTSWWDTSSISSKNSANWIGSGAEVDVPPVLADLDKITASLILSSSYWKDKLSDAYQNYNDKNNTGKKIKARFYTVGLGSDINGPYVKNDSGANLPDLKYAWAGLNPASMADVTNGNGLDDGWSSADLTAAQTAASNVTTLINDLYNNAPEGVKQYKDYSQTQNYEYAYYYQYAENYSELNKAFNKLAEDVANATKEVKQPVTEETVGSDTAAIHFSDPIGAGMEVDTNANSIMLYGATADATDIYTATKNVTESTPERMVYEFDVLTGKVVINNEANGNQTVEWFITAEDMKRCLIRVTTADDGSLSYSPITPLKLQYTIKSKSGAISSSNPTLYTNRFSVDNTNKVIGGATATFTPVFDNSYYYYTNAKVGIVDTLENVGFKDMDTTLSHYVTGTPISNLLTGQVLKDVYVTTAMANAQGAPDGIDASKIGFVVDSIEITETTSAFYTALGSTISDCVEATDKDDTTAVYAFKAGIAKSHFHTVKKVGKTTKDTTGNLTKTAENVSEEFFEPDLNGKYSVKMVLGNNGRIDISGIITKTGPTNVTPGGEVTYKITVENPSPQVVTDYEIKDVVPAELQIDSYTNSADAAATKSGNTLTWQIPTIAAGGKIELEVKTTLLSTSTVKSISNTASITKIAGLSLTTPAVSEEVTTNVMRDIKIDVNKDGTPWTQHNKTFILQDKNDASIIYDLSDAIPDGEYVIVEKLAASTRTTNQIITITNGKGNQTINYYTLTVQYDSGVNQIVDTNGNGDDITDVVALNEKVYLFLDGETANITAYPKNDYVFDEWQSTNNTAVVNDNQITVTMNVATTLEAKTKRPNSVVTITSDLDGTGNPWSDFDKQTIKLVEAGGTEITDLNNVPNGSYTLYINDKATKYTFNIDNTITTTYSQTVKYYTLSLQAESGKESYFLNSPDISQMFTGAGVYLEGESVHVHAHVDHSKAHFTGWTFIQGNGVSEFSPGFTADTEHSYLTINAKTTLQANADTPPVQAVAIVIDVQKDGATWNEHLNSLTTKAPDGTEVTDITGISVAGTYEIYDGNKLVGTVVITEDEIKASATKNITIDYYTLVVNKGVGITSTSLGGIYFKGETASFNAVVDSNYYFAGWTGSKTSANLNETIVMDSRKEVTANAKLYNVLNLSPKLDGATYPSYTGVIEVKDAGGNDVADITKLPDGTYSIYADGKLVTTTTLNLGVTQNVDINYYTLTLDATDGIGQVMADGNPLTNGKGIYLSGEQVTITAVPDSKYSFKNWTGTSTLTNASELITMNKKQSYTANATQTSFKVTVDVNKDSLEYQGFDKNRITLKNGSTIISDLNNVPNGTYKIQVDGKDTYQEVIVNNGDVTQTLDYFTLNLSADVGVNKLIVDNQELAGGVGVYLKNTKVRINAEVKDKYTFVNWTGTTTITNQSELITMDKKHEYTAHTTQTFFEVTIEVNKDGSTYEGFDKDTITLKNGNTVITDLSKVPNGTYKVQVDGKDTYQEVIVNNGDVRSVLDYFTLAIKAGSGIDKVTVDNQELVDGIGVYLKDSQVTIDADVKDKYTFINWTGTSTITDQSKLITMDKKQEYTANATAPLFEVTVDVKKDGFEYEGYDKSKITLKSEDTEITDLTKVPSGNYTVYIDGKETNKTINITDMNGTITLDYYTVTLNKGLGINDVVGSGIYLEGTTATIEATINDGYTFINWTGDKTIASNKNSFIVDKTLNLMANADKTIIPTDTHYKVTVEVNKDGQSWIDFNRQVTLKKEDGTIITDLTKVPNGNYVVYIDGEATQKTLQVNGKDTILVLNYYTLTLDKGLGIDNVFGTGVYLEGSTITIDASMFDGYQFGSWSGDLSLNKANITIEMNSTLHLTANATQIVGGTETDKPDTGDKSKEVLPFVTLLAASCAVGIVLAGTELMRLKKKQ